MQFVTSARNGLEKLTETIALLLFGIGIIVTIYGTFARTFAFIPSISWSAEVTRFSIISAVLLVIGIGIRRGMQVSFELILDKLPSTARLILQMINNGLIITFFVFIGFYGYEMAITSIDFESPILRIPMVFPYLFLPLGAILAIMGVVFLAIDQIIKYLTQIKQHSSKER